jgi:multidrug resistance protein MdtO
MATQSAALPSAASESTFDQAVTWFWDFLKNEMAPYPGRAWVVARMTIAATLVMALVMTFRLPNGFAAALYTIIVSRESLAATLRSGIRIAISATAAMAYAILTIAMMVDDPLTHYLWVMCTLLLCFFAMRIIPEFGAALAFSLPSILAITVWDANTVNVNTRVSNTLWLGYLIIIGAAVTVVVEYAFRKVHPATTLIEEVEGRLKAVEEMLRSIGLDLPVSVQTDKSISQYSGLGTSGLRRLLLRSGYSRHFVAQMNAAVALVGRLIDLAASMRITRRGHAVALDKEDRERCLSLADNTAELRRHLLAGRLSPQIDLSVHERPSKLAFLAAMERTVALIPHAFSGSKSTSDFLVRAPMDEDRRQKFFAPDAFSNPAHLQFAVRGSLAALVCYITYTAIDWQGLKSSMVTCLLTAVSTIGSSRQRQVLRLSGFFIGGIVFGMGAQVFVLSHLDSIVGFGMLFVLVAAISAWIATSTPRISFLGLQLALAFNLVNLQEFTIQTSLAIARDRLVGVLLGLFSMWLIFDRLWVRNALNEMQSVFARNLQMFAELTQQLLRPDRNNAIKRIRQLREQINNGFAAVRAQSDAILFEFGPSRQRKLEIREHMRRWDPLLRTLLQVLLTFSHYRLPKPLQSLPAVAEAEITFSDDIARTIQLMADEVCGNAPGTAPDVRTSAERLEAEIRKYYVESSLPIAPRAADVISLIRNLIVILAPLYEDIHVAFANNAPATADPLPLAHLDTTGEHS